MKFDDYRYERPDVEKFKQDFNALLKDLNDTSPLEVQKASVTAINKLRNEFDTMQTLVSVRHSINTTDEFYKAEQEFMDEIGPVVQEYITDYYKALVHSKYRAEFEKEWGAQLLQLAEVSLRTFSPEIIEDLQLENKLSTEYSQLIASAKILSKVKSVHCLNSHLSNCLQTVICVKVLLKLVLVLCPNTRLNLTASMMSS